MGFFFYILKTLLIMAILTSCNNISTVFCGNLQENFDITWGGEEGRGKIADDNNGGELMTLSLDKTSGSGFQSKNEYLFGTIDMQIKLVPGNSAGTVTAYYLSSQGPSHDEIDFEFLGNISGEPYTVHTNVYTQGKGEKEQQFHLWFDPTLDYHTFSVLWSPQTIVFSVDNTPIREFKNLEHIGVQFPRTQPMKLYSSLWSADEWATRGGLIKTDWAQAPFTATYRNFRYARPNKGPMGLKRLGPLSEQKLSWVQKNYKVYDYCTDAKRFPQGFPKECNAA